MTFESWPHGLCECRDGCQCGRNPPGPVVYSVVRHGKPLRVCTRCDLSWDTEKTLLLTGEEESGPLCEYDALGLLVVLGQLRERKEAKNDTGESND